jgi:hypothetical protein
MSGKKADVPPPITGGTYQTMQQKERSARSGAVVVKTHTIYRHELIFDPDLVSSYSHYSTQPPKFNMLQDD